jgi:hypothetical protein
MHILEPGSKFAAITQRAPDGIRLMMQVDDDVGNAETGGVLSYITNQRFSQHG